MTFTCPVCEAEIELEDVEEGEIISCPECGTELEVVGLDPPTLQDHRALARLGPHRLGEAPEEGKAQRGHSLPVRRHETPDQPGGRYEQQRPRKGQLYQGAGAPVRRCRRTQAAARLASPGAASTGA